MPADARGSLYRTKTGHGIRRRDEHGVLRRKSGFISRSAARSWFEDVEPAPSPLTLAQLLDEFLAQHVAEANTIRRSPTGSSSQRRGSP